MGSKKLLPGRNKKEIVLNISLYTVLNIYILRFMKNKILTFTALNWGELYSQFASQPRKLAILPFNWPHQ